MSIEPFPQRTRHHQPLPDGIARPGRQSPPAAAVLRALAGQPCPAGGEQQQGMRRAAVCPAASAVGNTAGRRGAAHLCQPVGAGSFTGRRRASASGRAGRRIGRLRQNPLRVPVGQQAPVQDIGTLLSALAQQWEGACWLARRVDHQTTAAGDGCADLGERVAERGIIIGSAGAAGQRGPRPLLADRQFYRAAHGDRQSRRRHRRQLSARAMARALADPDVAGGGGTPMSRSARRHCRRRSGPIPASCRGKTCWPGGGEPRRSCDQAGALLLAEGLARPLLADRYLAVAARAAGLLAPHTGPDAI